MMKSKIAADLPPEHQIEVGSALSHDEQLRGAALSIACRYYVETIVKDGELYREMVRDNRVLKPATYIGVLDVAFAFEAFIRGDLKKRVEDIAIASDPAPLEENSGQAEPQQ